MENNINNLVGRKVQVYYNLHKHVWSIRCAKTRLVIAHCDAIRLEKVRFKVSEKGRQKVLAEKRKNVHAYVEGVVSGNKTPVMLQNQAYYNPYKVSSFIDVAKNVPIFETDNALLLRRKVYIN